MVGECHNHFQLMILSGCVNASSSGCILEVDLEYPKEHHDLHNDYSLAPERLNVAGVEKLIPNLCDKKNYVVHHKALKQYESFGLKITKIHRGIKFKESAWLKPYIDLNTELRTKAKNDFEKDFFKLMNNSVFGKTMENIRSRVDIRLVTNEDLIEQHFSINHKSQYSKLVLLLIFFLLLHLHLLPRET